MMKNIIKSAVFLIPTQTYCCSLSGSNKNEQSKKTVEDLKKELESLNIDDNDIISFSDFISSGAKFDSNKTKVKFDNDAVVNVTKFAEKFKNNIEDLNETNICDGKIEEKLKAFIDRIINCLKTKLNNGYNLDDNNLKKLYIVVEFKSDVNSISSECMKFTGNLKNNMSNFFKKGSNVYVLNNIDELPVNTDKGIYSSDIYNKKENKKEKNEYLFNSQYLFKDKNNKETTIDALNEKSGSNNYYAVVNLKDYKDYYVCLKKDN